jgi:diguanylate cyclase (GGDEF)-like protein
VTSDADRERGSWVLLLGTALALAAAPFVPLLAPQGPLARSGVVAALLALAALGGLHRPLGGSGLGLGTAALPLAAFASGAAAAAWIAALATALVEVARRLLAARLSEPPPERRGWRRIAEGAARAALAALAAAVVWDLVALPTARVRLPAGLAALLPALVYVLVAGALELWLALGRGAAAPLERLRQVAPPWILDGAGWLLGLLLIEVAREVSWTAAVTLLAVVALVAAEAARIAGLQGFWARRAEDLQRLGRAAERIGAGGKPMAAIAEQIRTECRNILPFLWFELAVPDAAGGRMVWTSGPEGELAEGVGAAGPGEAPPPLPGIHRRGSWEVIERELRVEGQSLATLRLWCDPRRVEPGARQLLEELLPQMAASVYRALLDREARQDALTGVAVRRVLEARLQEAFRRSCEDGAPFAVIMCDLDHFKSINDQHGHDAGDQALRAVAKLLDTHRRPEDLLCRYGGEEFTLLCEGIDGAAALAIAEELRARIEGLDFRLEEEEEALQLTMSFGVAGFPELHIKTATELLLLADAALYQAKRRGRNRSFLDTGGGRYRDARGKVVTAERRRPVQPPQIFV